VTRTVYCQCIAIRIAKPRTLMEAWGSEMRRSWRDGELAEQRFFSPLLAFRWLVTVQILHRYRVKRIGADDEPVVLGPHRYRRDLHRQLRNRWRWPELRCREFGPSSKHAFHHRVASTHPNQRRITRTCSWRTWECLVSGIQQWSLGPLSARRTNPGDCSPGERSASHPPLGARRIGVVRRSWTGPPRPNWAWWAHHRAPAECRRVLVVRRVHAVRSEPACAPCCVIPDATVRTDRKAPDCFGSTHARRA